MQMAVDPHVRRALDHKHEFFFRALRMRVRGPAAWRQAAVVNADARDAQLSGERRADAHQFGTAFVVGVVRIFQFGPVADELGSFHQSLLVLAFLAGPPCAVLAGERTQTVKQRIDFRIGGQIADGCTSNRGETPGIHIERRVGNAVAADRHALRG